MPYITLTWRYTTSDYTALHCIASHLLTLHYLTLRYIMLHWTKIITSIFDRLTLPTLPHKTLHYTALLCISLHWTRWHYTRLITLHCSTLRYTTTILYKKICKVYYTVYYLTSHYITLHSPQWNKFTLDKPYMNMIYIGIGIAYYIYTHVIYTMLSVIHFATYTTYKIITCYTNNKGIYRYTTMNNTRPFRTFPTLLSQSFTLLFLG